MSNYKNHAEIWDWAGYDRTIEFEFWFKLAKGYGDTVLSIMSAIGETGAYLAERGLNVTAIDYTKEMVLEGQKRFSYLKNLKFLQADARDFDLKCFFDYAFIGSTDLHHMLSRQDVVKVLSTIKKHLKSSGGLGLELWYPSEKSWSSPKRRFDSLKNTPNQKIWKEGTTSFNLENHRIKISQDIFIERNNKVNQFTHEFEMQLYKRDELLNIFKECGFSVEAEYGDYNFNKWTPESSKWLVELRVK